MIDLVQLAIETSASRGGKSSWLKREQLGEGGVRPLADQCDGRQLSSESDPPLPFSEYWGTLDDGRAWRVIVTA